MAAKKPLELTPTPLDEEVAETRFDSDRRLELTTKSGNAARTIGGASRLGRP